MTEKIFASRNRGQVYTGFQNSVLFSWYVISGDDGLGATAGLSSSARIENTAGQASSGARY